MQDVVPSPLRVCVCTPHLSTLERYARTCITRRTHTRRDATVGARRTDRNSGRPQRNIVPLAHSTCCPCLATVLLQHVTCQRKGTPQSAAGEEARQGLALCIAHQSSKCEQPAHCVRRICSRRHTIVRASVPAPNSFLLVLSATDWCTAGDLT